MQVDTELYIFLHDTSTNGTYINGVQHINEIIELKENDTIGIGFPANSIHCCSPLKTSLYAFILEREQNGPLKLKMYH